MIDIAGAIRMHHPNMLRRQSRLERRFDGARSQCRVQPFAPFDVIYAHRLMSCVHTRHPNIDGGVS